MRSDKGWYLDDGGTLVVDGFVSFADGVPWQSIAEQIRAVRVQRGAQVERLDRLFAGCRHLTAVDGMENLTCLGGAGADDASEMLASCSKFTWLDVRDSIPRLPLPWRTCSASAAGSGRSTCRGSRRSACVA